LGRGRSSWMKMGRRGVGPSVRALGARPCHPHRLSGLALSCRQYWWRGGQCGHGFSEPSPGHLLTHSYIKEGTPPHSTHNTLNTPHYILSLTPSSSRSSLSPSTSLSLC
jgi:hypothetical protein